jgi:hypothetical protein
VASTLQASSAKVGIVTTDQTTHGTTDLVAADGKVAAGVTDSGNPVKVGGKYNSTLPTLTNGQRGDLQLDSSSLAIVNLGTKLDPVNDSVTAVAKHGTKAFTTNAPTNAAAQALAANSGRIKALITNNGTMTAYLGKDNTVTTSNGVPLYVGASVEDDVSTDAWYAIVASGTGDLRIVEVS